MISANIQNPERYDKYIVAFSGGKDSMACFLQLLDLGIPKEKIELWHHDIDGKDGTFMDWEVTPAYCKAFAKAFGVPIYFSWKEGGFRREMFRENSLTAPISFECADGTIKTIGGVRGKESTRRKFPQISPDLSVRWCSAYLKIDVCAAAIRHQERFEGIKTVVLSGERGEESAARGRYMYLEPDRSDLWEGRKPRYVDRWRPVKDWTEQEVWEIIERYNIRVHPCYYMGWSRCSCKFCIFGNADQFASAYFVSSTQGDEFIKIENDFGTTMKRNISLVDLINKGNVYESVSPDLVDLATSYDYNESIFMENWILPSGAYGESCGPS
jgi:3'-phosphoadenosine 5'-phosphosulfate sulfotransferase (PAPS reductase)/FAD synthetase